MLSTIYLMKYWLWGTFTALLDWYGRAHINCSKVFVLKPFSEKCNFMRWIDDCKCILSNVEGTNSLPMRKMEKGMFSTPWIDRFCLIISILLAYFFSPLMSNYIEEYLGDNSYVFSLVFLLLLSPFIGDFVSRRITNYIYKW